MPVAEIQPGGNSFRKIRYAFRKICFYKHHSSWGPEFIFWGPKVCIWMKTAVQIHLDTSRGHPGPEPPLKN